MTTGPGRWGLRASSVVLAVCILTWTASAVAYHNDAQKVTEDTAYTLQDGEIRLGLWRLEYGLLEDLDLGTWILPWVFRIVTLHAKYEVWHDEQWSVAARLGLFAYNLENLDVGGDAAKAVFYIVPIETVASWRFADDWTASLGATYTKVAIDGEYHPNPDELEPGDPASMFDGAVAVTNLQFFTTFEWRLSPLTALVLHGRYLAYQQTSGASKVVFQPDDFTTIEVHGEATSDLLDVQHAASATLSAVFSWETFNLRVGAGYGNWTVPVVNFVLPVAITYPEVAVYWRW